MNRLLPGGAPCSRLTRAWWVALCSLLWLGLLRPASLHASHNLAGQITAELIDPTNPRRYRITLTTYTDPAPQGVDRCSADIIIFSQGQGSAVDTLRDIIRSNGPFMNPVPPQECDIDTTATGTPRNGVEVRGTVKENIYVVEYTFPGGGTYDLVYYDIARHAGVVNICDPESRAFSVVTTLEVASSPLEGQNNSVELLNQPLDDACIGEIWTHQPGAWDVDGDSLSYEIVGSLDYNPDDIYSPGSNPGVPACYQFPDNPAFGPSTLEIDPLTGLVSWTTPQIAGIYNFGIIVYEWRNGRIIGQVRRDIAVWVFSNCDNQPPVVETITDTCIYAGEELRFDFLAFDPDSVDSLYLDLNNGNQGDNGPFIVDNPATIEGEIIDLGLGSNRNYVGLPQAANNNDNMPLTNEPDTIKGTVVWQTVCGNIRRQHYQVDFYATDNKQYDEDRFPTKRTLATYQSVRIRVIPPPPTNLRTECNNGRIRLTWDPPNCQDELSHYNVYRKSNGSSGQQDTTCCEENPTAQGYQFLAEVDAGETTFLDPLENVEGGLGDSLCYAVTAVFQEGAISSEEDPESCQVDDCIPISTEPLYLTNDSIGVDNTDPANGRVALSWSQPTVDACIFPAPYTYRVYRANNNGFPAIEVITQPYDDTTYVDEGLDTENRGYNYRVEIFAADGRRIESSGNDENVASSIFLEADGIGSGVIQLEWSETVPWANSQYEIHRADDGGPYQLLTVVPGTGANVHTFTDSSLNPSWEYCYFIRSVGSWNEEGVKDPLINDSQAACDFAQDDDPPCPPTPSTVITGLDTCPTELHQLRVRKSEQECDDDAVSFTVEFTPHPDQSFRPLPDFQDISYDVFGADTLLRISQGQRFGEAVGCYAIRATDSLGNVSELSGLSCIDYCPTLVMSNVFTPNGDDRNDVFEPLRYRDVRIRRLRIYDRWGRIMHQADASTDIDNLWNGITETGRRAPDGVYFYVLEYEELGLIENTPRTIRSSVTLMR